jgi:hypothetical protein
LALDRRLSIACATFDKVSGRICEQEETSMNRRLKGRRIAALAADGFEKVELVVPMKALHAAGAKIDMISLRHGNIRGMNLHEPASRVHVDKTIAEANPDDYDGLPGGFINPDLLRQSAEARAFVRAFDEGREADRDPVSRALGARVGGTAAGEDLNLMAGRS